ncbi:hypothetical protein [Aliikangiella sp. IMCC44359]|uniref:hypothetical protein n=1 Tax=Aliikangiella sp. IMCC44359 TaxID=3459125 RepID=UPI00403B338F
MKYVILSTLLIISSHTMAVHELHIENQEGISLESWLEICEVDSTLTHEKTISVKNPNTGELLSIEAEGMCVWRAEGFQTTFDYRSGKISFSHSDDALLKAKEIASKLKATIIGDEAETY